MISIIVPTLNEEKFIEKLLCSIDKLIGEKEVIFVDGGSTDSTRTICNKYGKVIESNKGRAFQMNEGAKIAKGEVFWFVHADSILQDSSLKDIYRAIEEGNIGGGFSLYFYDDKSIFMNYIAKSSNIRAKRLGLIFGDQGLFVKKEVFNDMKGYAEVQLMEDWEFSKRLKKKGNIKVINSKIQSSARRFQENGKVKTHLKMHLIKLLYIFGVSHQKLNNLYRGKK